MSAGRKTGVTKGRQKVKQGWGEKKDPAGGGFLLKGG